jgi:hypothetical protein
MALSINHEGKSRGGRDPLEAGVDAARPANLQCPYVLSGTAKPLLPRAMHALWSSRTNLDNTQKKLGKEGRLAAADGA